MLGELVAVDLETTGLDPSRDAIIEVGAVRTRDGEIIDEFSTLIDPDRPIPPIISYITGITSDDVIGAPRIQTVIPRLQTFIGSAPIIGHNVGFDTGFLHRHGIVRTNPRIDTYDLASILLPRAPRYNLGSLTKDFQIEHPPHRGLNDARATALLYWQLWQRLLDLPMATLYEIKLAAQDVAWDSRIVFDAALRERIARGEQPVAPDFSVAGLFGGAQPGAKSLRPKDIPAALDGAEVMSLLEASSALAASLPQYEHRPQQAQMVQSIVAAFNQSQHQMIEAGTGTGKSLAYLLPSILWAVQNNERVVVSTNTINLQEQLMAKDIPLLQDALGIPFRAALMKGRGNYLCPRRLLAVRRRRPTSVDELRTLAKILVWMLESTTGDKGEISLRGAAENLTWQRLSAEDEGCTLDRCAAAMDGACPFYRARKAADAAHLVVVNHALLVSDAMMENRVLPDYRYLIVDEAHHLEDATTNGLSFRLDEATLRRRLSDLGGLRRGLLGGVLNSVRAGGASEREMGRLETFVEIISDATRLMEVHIGTLFDAVRAFMDDVSERRAGDYSTQVRVTDKLRAKMSFSQIQTAWSTLVEFFDAIGDAMSQLTTALNRMQGKAYDIPDLDDLINSAAAAARYFEEVKAQLTAFALAPDANMVYWISAGQDAEFVSLNAAPLHIGALVDKHLWSAKDVVVMTSATLQTNRSFDYIRDRLGADHVETVELGSPFNYRDSTLLYIPNDMPDPSDRNRYQHAVERGFIELAAALNGRVLGLFTSYAQLRQTAQAITPRLALGNIVVYDQSDGSSRQALLDGFKSSERAVLLGTRSFWEGVDIPGEALSALVIVRLPFAVPTDPIFAARSETYANSFNEYALPDAILRFRQGFGRLIRTKTDRGVVTVFDGRILTKNYGASFIEALPDCTVQYGSLQTLPEAAKIWLSKV